MEPYYQDNSVVIYNGDCLDIINLFDDQSFDCVLTSPPYNRKRNDKYQEYTDIINDYFNFLCLSIDMMLKKTNGNVFFNIQKKYYNKTDIFEILGKYSKEICELFIWSKSNPMPASGKNITNAYEFIIVFGDSIKSNQTYTKNHLQTSVAKMMKEHKAIMNHKVANFFIENFTNVNNIILDPFCGVGTTLIEAKKAGRKAVGIEISEKYCKIAREKIKDIYMLENNKAMECE